jgi:hypothetical protein
MARAAMVEFWAREDCLVWTFSESFLASKDLPIFLYIKFFLVVVVGGNGGKGGKLLNMGLSMAES